MATTNGKTRNTGELSETYAVLYILGKSKISLVDGDLRSIPGEMIQFLRLYRLDETSKRITYILGNDARGTPTISYDGLSAPVTPVPASEFEKGANELLVLIRDSAKNKTKTPINAPEVVKALKLLQSKSTSAKSIDKSDFTADVLTRGMALHDCGYSIKSELGAKPTLINASKDSSYFEFEVLKNGAPLSVADKGAALAAGTKPGLETLRGLLAKGFELRFYACPDTLRQNLAFMDFHGARFLASVLLEFLTSAKLGEARSKKTFWHILQSLAERVFTEGTANEWWGIAKTPETLYAIFERRMREILVCFLSSATVGTLWDGREITKGGMIVVTKLGDVVCLELASRDELGKYLVRNCTLESPSTTRMDGGHVIERDGRLFVRMHLNVRFV